MIHSEAGWLYITHVASRAEASDSCAPLPAGNTSAELEVEQVVLGPGALLQGLSLSLSIYLSLPPPLSPSLSPSLPLSRLDEL